MNLKMIILTQNDIKCKCKVDNFILFHREAVTILAHAVDLSLLFKVRQLLLYFANVEGLKLNFLINVCVVWFGWKKRCFFKNCSFATAHLFKRSTRYETKHNMNGFSFCPKLNKLFQSFQIAFFHKINWSLIPLKFC